MKSICMSCKFFKIEDTLSGFCRWKEKDAPATDKTKKMVRHDDTCGQWVDCGQQYYIRRGWVKAQNRNKEDVPGH